jgi:hypothetical protein
LRIPQQPDVWTDRNTNQRTIFLAPQPNSRSNRGDVRSIADHKSNPARTSLIVSSCPAWSRLAKNRITHRRLIASVDVAIRRPGTKLFRASWADPGFGPH